MAFNHRAHLCFDLDGTLVDSAASIEEAIELAFSVNSIPVREKNFIGPPLDELIRRQGITDNNTATKIKQAFITAYDEKLCITASLYPGVKELLRELSDLKIRLTLVTNKRIHPSIQILAHHDIIQFFSDIIGSDSYNISKSDSLKRLRSNKEENIYIGDTQSDCTAAMEARYSFLFASWGYGECVDGENLDTPSAVLKFFDVRDDFS